MSAIRQQLTDNAFNVDVSTTSAAYKITAATVGTAYGMTEYTLNDFVAIATLLFVILQIGLLMPKYAQLYRAWRAGRRIKVDIHE